MAEILKTFHAFTACGAQFDGCVAPSESVARAMIARRYDGQSEAFIRGEMRSLDGFTVAAMKVDPLRHIMVENAAEIIAVDDSAAALDRLTEAQKSAGYLA